MASVSKSWIETMSSRDLHGWRENVLLWVVFVRPGVKQRCKILLSLGKHKSRDVRRSCFV
jgi:hypothetical protein